MVAALRAAGCVFAEEEAAVIVGAASSPAHLRSMVAERARGLPLEQVVGWAAFGGLRIAVRPGVFVPRRRTELMAAEAARLARDATARGAAARRATARPGTGGPAPARPLVVDLCCGSGAVGRVVAGRVPVELHACDVDPVACACARDNLAGWGTVHTGDLFDALPAALRGRVDVLAANVPYVPTAEIPLLPAEARDHEARVALDGGADGLAVARRVLGEARGWLAAGGSVLMEASDRQVGLLVGDVEAAGLVARVVEDDELGATVVVGTRGW